MPRKSLPWFRMYSEMPSDRKIRRLTPTQRWIWTCILCAAGESPTRGQLLVAEGVAMTSQELAEYADVRPKEMRPAIELMTQLGMVRLVNGVLEVANWEIRQRQSDSSTARVKAHRDRAKERSNDVPNHADGTGLERYRNGRSNRPEEEGEEEAETETDNVPRRGGGNRHVNRRASDATDPPPICSKHPDGNPTDQPCVGCARVRKWTENEPTRAHARRQAAIANCHACDPTGWLLALDGQPAIPAIRCTHTTETP